MEVSSNGSRRRKVSNGVLAGSVWESRMKLDEFKVFQNEENSEEINDVMIEESSKIELDMDDKKVNFKPRKQSAVMSNGKRKTWKTTESSEGSPIQIARQRSELTKRGDEQCKELRSDGGKELGIVSVNGTVDKSPVQAVKARSFSLRGSVNGAEGNSSGSEKTPIPARRSLRLEAKKALLNEDVNVKLNSEQRKAKAAKPNDQNSLQLVRADSSSRKASDENVKDSKNLEVPQDGIDKTQATECDEGCKEFGVCEEKVVTSDSGHRGKANSAPISEMANDYEDCIDNEDAAVAGDDEENDVEVEEKSLVVKEMSIEKLKSKRVVVIDEKKQQLHNERPNPVSPIVKKQTPPLVNNVTVHRRRVQEPFPARAKPEAKSSKSILPFWIILFYQYGYFGRTKSRRVIRIGYNLL